MIANDDNPGNVILALFVMIVLCVWLRVVWLDPAQAGPVGTDEVVYEVSK